MQQLYKVNLESSTSSNTLQITSILVFLSKADVVQTQSWLCNFVFDSESIKLTINSPTIIF